MRLFNTCVVDCDYKFKTSFTALISGSSGAGKSTFIKNLIKCNRIDKPKKILYHFPANLGKPPVKWHLSFPDIEVVYEFGLPENEDYWTQISKGTLGKFTIIFTKAIIIYNSGS